jgi:HD-like signal output (HDOD) protein
MSRDVSVWSSLRRVFGGADESQPAFRSDSAVGVIPRPAAVSASRRPPQPAVAKVPKVKAPEPEIDARDRLKARLAEVVSRVRENIRGDDWTPAVRDLLDALTDDSRGHLRQMPDAAQRALRSCEDENVSTSTLVELFEKDPMLTEALLARANSAYYSRSTRPCFSLAEAIVRQGRRSAHSVILQQVLGGMVCRPGGIWTEMAAKVWAHMVRTGPVARAIAPAFDVDPEQAMTLGLLHDVGKLVVFDRMSALRTATRGNLHFAERPVLQMLRVAHEPLGGVCALQWHLGADSALAIAAHHRDPLPAEPDPLSEVIWLAERWDLAREHKAPFDLDELWQAGQLTGRLDEVRRFFHSEAS